MNPRSLLKLTPDNDDLLGSSFSQSLPVKERDLRLTTNKLRC